LFTAPDFQFQNPLELGPYTMLSFALVLSGIVYIKAFYGITHLFKAIQIPNHIKPAIGGLCTGLIGFFWPYTLAFGYGMAQKALLNEVSIGVLLALAFGKIVTTAFSIGSGGSGGVFGPSIVIGGAIGGAVGQFFHQIIPGIVSEPAAFVVVGMAGFFTAVSNTPISTIIFVSEMTSSYHLLLPSLLVCSLSYLLSQKWTIYKKQVKSRIDSPAHAGEFFVDILQTIKVRDLMYLVKKVTCVREETPFSEFKTFFSATKQHYFPVMDTHDRLIGIFSSTDIRGVLFSKGIDHLVVMQDIMQREIIVTSPEEDLNTVLQKMTIRNIDSLPVTRNDDHGILIGMLNRRDVIAFYNERVQNIKQSHRQTMG
jgi:CIC family chloride channel protein